MYSTNSLFFLRKQVHDTFVEARETFDECFQTHLTDSWEEDRACPAVLTVRPNPRPIHPVALMPSKCPSQAAAAASAFALVEEERQAETTKFRGSHQCSRQRFLQGC